VACILINKLKKPIIILTPKKVLAPKVKKYRDI
jgi:hypothetical protein